MTTQGPVLALLPFEVVGGSGNDGVIAQGLVEDLCGELARFPSLHVVSWMSGRTVAGLPDQEAGRRLGATHIMRGRFQRHGDRLRVAADLIDAATGAQLWSERLETAPQTVFDLQDELVARIAATFVARLEETALRTTRRKPTESLAAYELTLRGLALLRQGRLEADEEARRLFASALELDPHYARAHGGMSLSYFNEWGCQLWNRFRENGQAAYEHAHRALDIDDSDPILNIVIGRILLYDRRFEQASWYFDRALALCPNDAETLIQLAICEVFLGRPEVGIERGDKAMRLNPYHPNAYYGYAAFPHFTARNFERFLEVNGKSANSPLICAPAHTAIAHAHLGQMAEARHHLALFHEKFRRLITFGREPAPDEACRWLLDYAPYRRQGDRELVLEGFRMLGSLDTKAVGLAGAGRKRAGPHEEGAEPCSLRHGDGWLVDYGGRQVLLADLKGLHDIRRLLERPGEEIHCLDLAEREDYGYGDEVLDDQARQALKMRIRDLQEELAEAEDMNDIGRAERLRTEMDRLVETLSRALGLGGRDRRLGSLSERARTTVTWRIRHAVRKIGAVHGPLGRHLANSLRTGTFCAYKPEQPVAWRFTGSPAVAAATSATFQDS